MIDKCYAMHLLTCPFSFPPAVLSIAALYSNAHPSSPEYILSSSADSVIAKHPIPPPPPPNAIPDATSASDPLALLLPTTTPHKVLKTHHTGQQSLVVRSDNRVFATAGWDGRIRVYHATKLTELACLKWHKDGCYAVDFAHADVRAAQSPERSNDGTSTGAGEPGRRTVAVMREARETARHWLAAGSKDGKVSLWEVY